MLFSFKTFLFKRLLINLLIFSIKIIKLILNTLYFVIVSILLKSAIPILGENLAIRISTFIILLSTKRSLIVLLRSSK